MCYYLHYYKLYNNKTPQKGRLPCTNLALQLMVTLLKLGHAIYLHFCKPYNNQTCQNNRPAPIGFTLQVMMAPPQLCRVTNIKGFIPTYISLMLSKLKKITDSYALILLGVYNNFTTTRSPDQRLWVYLHFFKPYNKEISQKGRPAHT